MVAGRRLPGGNGAPLSAARAARAHVGASSTRRGVLLFLAVLCALLFTVQPDKALAEGCRAEGIATLSSKLVCPYQPVELRWAIRLSCDEGIAPSCVRTVRLVDALPEGIVAWRTDTNGAEPDIGDDWTLEFTDGFGEALETSRRVVAVRGGTFALGGADITVEDESGQTINTSLPPQQLTVVPQCPRWGTVPIFLPIMHRPSCLPSAEPADIVLAIDRSASVGGDGLAAIGQHVRVLLDTLDHRPGEDRVGLVAFDRRAVTLAPLGTTPALLDLALRELQPHHGTRLEHGIAEGVRALGPTIDGRRRILVLITDGVAIGMGGNEAAHTAARDAREADVRILAMGIGPAPDWRLLNALQEPGSPRIAATSSAALPAAFRGLSTATSCVR